ncbi:UDP-2,4-diacetamido-2,4,6-trideoxy-beta-L-altropyranose hydrolase [Bacillus sp. CGMCC 1.16607]|uniref:UDP-2,4-diacetamido-2,4, 6-trideoxy-beta-L-altropyranose hydrolase n=1 Tax=Bacillus sp. CGMCC 1.16607 TaxID=3351842 RepID=UPI003644BE3C
MNTLIRVDASVEIGTGHVMRCLTLANLLRNKGAKIIFNCINGSGNLIDYIINEGFEVYKIRATKDSIRDIQSTIHLIENHNIDLLIIDHYQLDWKWEKEVRIAFPHVKIMVIDDLANRKHDCDLLLDQNYFNNYETRYEHLLIGNCKKLLGPSYLLLRPEFYEEEKYIKENDTKSILVFYGGSDPTGETLKALEALEVVDCSSYNIHVVVGLSNEKLEEIKLKCMENDYNFYVQINYLSQLMRKADLSLGAGGVTMWERCFLGLPSIVTVVAENQLESTQAAAEFGAVWNIGWYEDVKVVDLADIVNRALEQPGNLQEMSRKAKQLMQSDRKYETHPVVEAMMEVLES